MCGRVGELLSVLATALGHELSVAEKAGVGERLGYWQDVAKGSPTLPHSRYLLPPELRHM